MVFENFIWACISALPPNPHELDLAHAKRRRSCCFKSYCFKISYLILCAGGFAARKTTCILEENKAVDQPHRRFTLSMTTTLPILILSLREIASYFRSYPTSKSESSFYSIPTMGTNRNESQRVILHVCVTDLPGSPQNRHNFLGELFCRQVLRRSFNNKLQISSYDYMHLPPNFDTDNPVVRWFICDLNVNCRLDRNGLLSLPHKVYYVSRQKDEWYVSPYQYIYSLSSDFGFPGCSFQKTSILRV